MLDRRACERRVYRLAALLSGNPNAAADVIHAVLDAQPNLGEMESARMDRLTVLRSREITPGTIVSDAVPTVAAKALASLTPQQREAWVFVRMYRVPMREAARAMDCSVTALTTHMNLANEAMDAALGKASGKAITQEEAAAALRKWTMAIDVPRFFRQEQERRRRVRIALLILAIVGVLGAAVGMFAMIERLG